MTANVWNPGQGAIPVAQSKQTMLSQAFTAIDAQTVFNLTSFNYEPNTTSLIVAINGVVQNVGVDVTETSGSSFTVDTPLKAGDKVLALGFVGITATDASLTAIANTAKGYRDNALTYSQNSASSATAASTSASNASTSEGNALAYKNAAAQSASDANTSYNNTVSQSASALNGFRNKIINGDMRTNQRYGGNVTNAGPGFYLDRWALSTPTTNLNVQSVGDPPANTEFTNSMKISKSGTIAPAAGDQYRMTQGIEGVNITELQWGTANAKAITISFWVKSTLAGLYNVTLFVYGNPYYPSYVSTYTVNAANTWEYKTITIPGCTIGTWSTSNAGAIAVAFMLGLVGTNNQTASVNQWNNSLALCSNNAVNWLGQANSSFQLTGVQFELGTAATSFEMRPYAVELALCQRYYETISFRTESPLSSSVGFTTITLPYKQTKSRVPTITRSGETLTNCSYNTQGVNAQSCHLIYATSASAGNAVATAILDAEV